MTSKQFRKAALELPEATEGAHHGHADFRVGGKIFATLGYPDASCAVVMLTPDEQRFFASQFAEAFRRVPGKWGESGSTLITLSAARMPSVRDALRMAWERRAPKRLRRQ